MDYKDFEKLKERFFPCQHRRESIALCEHTGTDQRPVSGAFGNVPEERLESAGSGAVVKDMSTKPHGFVLILLKNYILHFCKNAEGLGKQRGQHICSANASHKWLSASLAVWGSPTGIHSRNSFPTRKNRSFEAFELMDTLHPEENGDSEAGFAEQSA